jgi:SPP1 gp7 family putative phage head morphogenesis protein
MAKRGTPDELRARRMQLNRARTTRRPGQRPTLPRAAELRYVRFLLKIVRAIHKRVEEDIIPLLGEPNTQNPGSAEGVVAKTDAISGRVKRELQRIEVEAGQLVVDIGVESELTAVASSVSTHSVKTIRRLTGIALRANDPAIAGAIPGFLQTNTSLIQKLATSQLRKVEQIIDEGVTTGRPVSTMVERLSKLRGVDERRAKLIARDQTLTLNAQVTQARHQRVGITHYFWSTSQDEVVRGNEAGDSMDHVSLEGKRFAYDNPPPDPRDGVTAHPGERINCRCAAIPDTANLLDPGEAA